MSLGFGTPQQSAFGSFPSLNSSLPTTTVNPFAASSFGTSSPFAVSGVRPALFSATSIAAPITSTSGGLFTGANFSGATTGVTAPGLGSGLQLFSTPLGSTPTQLAAIPGTNPGLTSTSLGLGGVDFSQAVTSRGSTSAGKSDKAAKETLLPNEIQETINTFRKYVKEQKTIREEIARVSFKPIHKVQEETTALNQLLSVVSSGLQRNSVAIDKLKVASAKDLQYAEVAQRTKDLPPSLQYENRAPTEYFHQLVLDFEKQMVTYRQQIESLEQHLSSEAQSSVLSPQELNIIIRRLHESFVALAAQLQTVHEMVQSQKETFLGFRSTESGESGNIFERKKRSATSSQGTPSSGFHQSLTAQKGPAPFSSFPSAAAMAMASALNRTQQTGTVGQLSSLGGSLLPTFSTGGYGSGAFGSPQQPGLALPVDNSKTFQLQKPPSGNKRGKRWTTN